MVNQRELVERASGAIMTPLPMLVGAPSRGWRPSPDSSCGTRSSRETRSRMPTSERGGTSPDFRDPDRFDAWLHRLTVNACLDAVRRAKATADRGRPVTDNPADDRRPDANVADRDQLERGFRRLLAEQRAVLVLHYYVGHVGIGRGREPRHPGRHGPIAPEPSPGRASCRHRGRRAPAGGTTGRDRMNRSQTISSVT